MARKFAALFALAAFCLLDLSCSPPWAANRGFKKTVKKDPDALGPKTSDLKIINVVLKTGESVTFTEKDPARIFPPGDSVTGSTIRNLTIETKDIKNYVRDKRGKIIAIETLEGRTYQVLSLAEKEGMSSFSTYLQITIPFSDIQQVWIRKPDVSASAAAAVGVLVITGVLMAVLLHSFEKSMQDLESCPFVYSFDGEKYVLDAEPYGAAASEGLKRTDWAEMTNLREVGGKYRVLLANEHNEKQYTDELKLVAVDHAPGVKIAPDLLGRVHTFNRPLAPVTAVDQNGRDIRPFVGENDRVFWLSPLDDRSLDGDGDFRDELFFEFPKPAGAKKVKLLANAWTTQWGAFSSSKFLELFGSSLPEQYADVDRHGPTYYRLMSWMSSEELYALKVWVETPGGWKVRGMIMEGAPVITKDKAYVLDVADIPGDVLRIKLRPPVNFWMVNSLAVDYGEDTPITLTELAAETAVDRAGRDVRRELASTDSFYLASPNRGEWTELVFTAPPLKAGLERTVLVKVSGYYKANIDATGEPQTELIEHVFDEPGFAARYSFREYLNWAAGIKAEQVKVKH
jgi:hypothetical protein